MNYPEELREKWNDCMYDERDIIQRFLEKQYDIRYGRQRDTWHFEDEIEVVSSQGSLVKITDIMLDKDCFVKFHIKAFGHDYSWWECFNFAYGELSKVIEALPDAEQLAVKNAVSDIASLCRECSVNLEENPFNPKNNGKNTSIAHVDYIDGRVVAYNHDGKVVSDEYASDFLIGLRDHINISVLHNSKEYKELMELLSLQENLRFECQNYGDATFVIDGTDMTVDVSAIQRNDKGNLVIYGADLDADENITLTEKEIKPQYLTSIVECIKPKYTDIMDTYNSHNKELVRKINSAWKNEKYHDSFGDILYALACRDMAEWEEKYNDIVHDSEDAMNHAHEIMEGVCDDQDLQTILSFIRYEE